MLLSEQILNEAFEDERDLIFDKPDLIEAAKKVFLTGDVTCHALDLLRHKAEEKQFISRISLESHQNAIQAICPVEFNAFKAKFNAITEKMKYADGIGDREMYMQFNRQREVYRTTGSVPPIKPRAIKVTRLFPYSRSARDGSIACVFVGKDGIGRYKVVVDLSSGKIVTVYTFHPADLLRRAIEFESIELLKLEKFGKLDVPEVDVYYTIKTLESPLLTTMKKDKLMAKFLKDIGIAPQVKQQAIRKFEEELRNRQV